MPTINQLIRKPRVKPGKRNKVPALESSPQKVLWGRLDLRVERHPKNELRLVLYTLSLDPAWLAV